MKLGSGIAITGMWCVIAFLGWDVHAIVALAAMFPVTLLSVLIIVGECF